ncbi:PIR Superfamily Protein [Plasmodium ovale wallikeri]|uniref:PIR Superfamily Protein n=1 Tax=Plasmodium ovale wallikeri TaxID=864142 RepID=A0A1A9AR77_PLAOA|nr:PIR Superfamily Protein [Plasmodium ovale wallikeri]
MSLEIKTFYNIANSYTKYKEQLDTFKRDGKPIYMGECDSFVNEHITNAEQDASMICKTVMKFLNLLKEESESYKIEGSKYLFYWLHNDVLNGKLAIGNTLILYKELYRRYNDEDKLNILNIYINQMNDNTSDKLVKLIGIYDILKNFDNSYKETLKKKECTCYSIDSFSRYVDECRKVYDNDFCDELKNFRNQYNFFIQNIIQCRGDQYLLPPVDNFDIVSTILVSLFLILSTSLILPLLYKFTPFGPWISQKIRKKKNIWDNINQENNILSNSYEMKTYNSNKKNYSIAYHSS